MNDFKDFAGLDDAYTEAISGWVSELRGAFELIDEWWEHLEQSINTDGKLLANLYWPAGPVSHPRIVAVYREYYFKIRKINLDQHQAMMDQDDMESSGWGSEAEDTGPSGPIPENTVLIDMMEDYAPDLRKRFQTFVYAPIGEDFDLEPC